MSPKVHHFLHRLGEIMGFTLMDTETGHRMLRQIYRVGEYDGHTRKGKVSRSHSPMPKI